MTKPNMIKSWLTWLFIAVCIITISISIAIMLVRFGILSPLGGGITAVMLIFGFDFIRRQIALAGDMKNLKSQVHELSGFKEDTDNKIGALAQQNIPEVQFSEQELRQEFTTKQTTFDGKIAGLEERLTALENAPSDRKPSQLPSASMTPFHEASLTKKDVPLENTEVTASLPASKNINLKTALRGDNLQMHLQPIVGLPSRSPTYFEAFMRLKTGAKDYLENNEFCKLAEDGGLMPAIDTKILFSSARLIRTLEGLKKSAGLFCTLSPSTLENSQSFNQIFDFLEANGRIKQSLIIEVSQRAYIALKDKERSRLGQIADLGYSLSLGDVADLNLHPKDLNDQGFKFVKLPVSIMLHANLDEDDAGIHPSQLSATLSEHGITLIAMDVERESQAISLIDFDVSYAQGLLFAPPRAVKAELLETK